MKRSSGWYVNATDERLFVSVLSLFNTISCSYVDPIYQLAKSVLESVGCVSIITGTRWLR